jgi:hypothetical protein
MSDSETPVPLRDDPIVRLLLLPLFLEQKEEVVWAARCCNRVSINCRQAPAKCGVCGKPPVDVEALRPDVIVG